MSREYNFIQTPSTTLASIEHILECFDKFRADADTKVFYNALKLAEKKLASSDKKNKVLWDEQITVLKAKTNEYINTLNKDNAGEKHELASSLLNIAKAYNNIDPKIAVGPVNSYPKYELLDHLDNLEEAFSQNIKDASPEYIQILEDIRYLRHIANSFEKRSEIDGACKMLFESSMSYIASAAGKSLSNSEKLRLDDVVRAAIISHNPAAEENDLSQKKVDRYIICAKLAKERISDYEKSDMLLLNWLAEDRKASFAEYRNEIVFQTKDKFFGAYLDSLSNEQLAEYAKLSSSDVKILYEGTQPKHYEPASEYIDKIKNLGNLCARSTDRKLYIDNDLLKDALSTKLKLNVSRTAVTSLAACMLLRDGYSMEDVLSPDALLDRKKEYGRQAAQLIKDNKALDIAEAYMDGEGIICDYLENILANDFPISPEFLLTKKAMNVSILTVMANDISQEMGIHTFKNFVNAEIETLRISDPNRADQLTEKYERMLNRGASTALLLQPTEKLFNDLNAYVSENKHDPAIWANLVMTSLTSQKSENSIIADIKDEMQKTGKSWSDIINKIDLGEVDNKYLMTLSAHSSLAENDSKLYAKIKKKITQDSQLTEKLIAAFFEGKYDRVTVTSAYKNQITGLETLINDLIDEKYKEADVTEKPLTIKKYSHAYRNGLVSKESFTNTVENLELLPAISLAVIPSKEAYIKGRMEILDKFVNDDYIEDVDYQQEALDSYFKSRFKNYTSLTSEQIEERKQIFETIRTEFNRAVGSRKLNLSIAAFGLKGEEKQKISGSFEALFTSDTSDEGIKHNEEVLGTLLNGTNEAKAQLIKDRLTELSKIDLSEVYENDPKTLQGHIRDIYDLYSAAGQIQALIDEGSRLGLDFTSDGYPELLHNLQIRADYALNLKNKLDFICSPAYTRVNEESLDGYVKNGFYVDDNGIIVDLADYAGSNRFNKVEAFSKGLEGLVNSTKNTSAQIRCHEVDAEISSRYFVYQNDENGNQIKGRIVDGEFVPAQFKMDGVILDTLYKDDLREALLTNIQKIKEYLPDFEMSEAEIEEQLSDENINKTYRAQTKAKIAAENIKKPKAKSLDNKFFKRANDAYISMHGVDKSDLLGASTIEGDQARRELVADVYNRIIKLDSKVFDFHNSFSNKENEGKNVDNAGNIEAKNDIPKEVYDKAFDYVLEHYEDLEYAMFTENSFDMKDGGFELDAKLQPETDLLKNKGSVLGGIARLIRTNHENMNTLVFPVNKLNVGQLAKIYEGAVSKFTGADDTMQFLKKIEELSAYLDFGLNNGNYIEDPTDYRFSANDFITRRKSLSNMKQSMDSLCESLLLANDGSEIFKTEQYSNLILKHEKLRYSLAEINGTISSELQERLCKETEALRHAAHDFELAVNKSSDSVKNVINPIMSRFHEELIDFTLIPEVMRQNVDFWNKQDSKTSDAIAKIQSGHSKALNKNSEQLKLESVISGGKVIVWERLTSEKDFSLIESEEQALAAIKHLASGLETTKKDHDEFKNLKVILQTSIDSIEKATPKDRLIALQNALESIGTAAKHYIIAKPERMKSFGLSEGGERRFEKARDLCLLAGALKDKPLIVAHEEPSQYKQSAIRILNDYSVLMELASVSGDSREFKRLKDKMAYVKDLIAVSDSDKFIRQQINDLADESLDYYIKKVDAPLHGTRGKKLDLVRVLYKLGQDCEKDPIPYPSREREKDDYRFEIALKIAKDLCKKNLRSRDITKIKEAKLCLSNSKAMIDFAIQTTSSGFFDRAFGAYDIEQLKKFSEKSSADLSAMYVARIPKPAANRPVDGYINKFKNFIKKLDAAKSSRQYISEKEGRAFSNNSLGYSTGRSMIRTYAVCELLNKGYKLSDILDPKKLKSEKRFYANKGLRLVDKALEKGDEAALEITTVLKNGGQKMIDCLNDLYGKMPDFSDNSLLTEVGMQMLAAALIAKDINQEIVRGIDMSDKDNPMVQEIKGINIKLDALNKPADMCHQYIQCFEKCCSTAPTKANDKADILIPMLINHQHINKMIVNMKKDPANNGKTMLEMLSPNLDVNSDNSKVVEITAIKSAILGALFDKSEELANDMFKDPLICDKYIEANSKDLFDQIEVVFNPVSMSAELKNINSLMNEVKNAGKQAVKKTEPVNPNLKKPEPQKQLEVDDKVIGHKEL